METVETGIIFRPDFDPGTFRYVRCISKTKPGDALYRVARMKEYSVSKTARGKFEGLSVGVLDPWANWCKFRVRKSYGFIRIDCDAPRT